MRQSFKTGLGFGVTSGVITTLGLMVGLSAGTHSKLAVIGGVLTIAIADAFSDALGIHVAQEAKTKATIRSIWEATISAFLAKLFFATTFIVPVLLLPLDQAIIVSIIWGFSVLLTFTYFLATFSRHKPWRLMMEHLMIGTVVVVLTHYFGQLIAKFFNYSAF